MTSYVFFCLLGEDRWLGGSGGVAAAAAAAAVGRVVAAPEPGGATRLAPNDGGCVVLASVRALPLTAVVGCTTGAIIA